MNPLTRSELRLGVITVAVGGTLLSVGAALIALLPTVDLLDRSHHHDGRLDDGDEEGRDAEHYEGRQPADAERDPRSTNTVPGPLQNTSVTMVSSTSGSSSPNAGADGHS